MIIWSKPLWTLDFLYKTIELYWCLYKVLSLFPIKVLGNVWNGFSANKRDWYAIKLPYILPRSYWVLRHIMEYQAFM